MEGLLARVDYLENIVTKLAKWTHFSEIVNFEFPAPAVISLEDENEKINPKSSRPRRRGRRRSLRSALSPEEEVTNPDIISDDTIIKTEDADTYEEMLPDDDPDFVIFPQDLDTGSDDDSFQADPDSLPSSSSKNLGLEESNRLRNCPSNSEDSGEQPPTKRHRRMHEWKRTQIFNNIDEAKLHIKNAQHFIYKSTRLGRDGRKLYYNCKINNCLRKMYLLKRNNTLKVELFETKQEHNHEGAKTVGIHKEIRLKIDLLFNSGLTKPNQIISCLTDEGVLAPSKVQLNNYLSALRKKGGPQTLLIGQVFEENDEIPSDQLLSGKELTVPEKKPSVS